jgi:hypothetical protein
MTAQDILMVALNFYEIKIVSVANSHIALQNNFEVEIEQNGIYKLLDDGYIIGPFDDVNELCKFVLM